MSPDGQKALIAGGATVFGSAHFRMLPDPRDPMGIHLHDVFELDLIATCWVQARFSTHLPRLPCLHRGCF